MIQSRLEIERQEIRLKVESRGKYNYLYSTNAFSNILTRSGHKGGQQAQVVMEGSRTYYDSQTRDET